MAHHERMLRRGINGHALVVDLGDDEGVLDTLQRAERAGGLEPTYDAPLLYHLAAVADLRRGREDEARRHWRQALKMAPWLDVAQDNVDDLRKPVGERHAAP